MHEANKVYTVLCLVPLKLMAPWEVSRSRYMHMPHHAPSQPVGAWCVTGPCLDDCDCDHDHDDNANTAASNGVRRVGGQPMQGQKQAAESSFC